jgi:hypothetical protein
MFFLGLSPAAVVVILTTHFVIDRCQLAKYWVEFFGVGCAGTLWPKQSETQKVPDHISFWLRVIVDNAMHLAINHWAVVHSQEMAWLNYPIALVCGGIALLAGSWLLGLEVRALREAEEAKAAKAKAVEFTLNRPRVVVPTLEPTSIPFDDDFDPRVSGGGVPGFESPELDNTIKDMLFVEDGKLIDDVPLVPPGPKIDVDPL